MGLLRDLRSHVFFSFPCKANRSFYFAYIGCFVHLQDNIGIDFLEDRIPILIAF